jgi:hypothetical protein
MAPPPSQSGSTSNLRDQFRCDCWAVLKSGAIKAKQLLSVVWNCLLNTVAKVIRLFQASSVPKLDSEGVLFTCPVAFLDLPAIARRLIAVLTKRRSGAEVI